MGLILLTSPFGVVAITINTMNTCVDGVMIEKHGLLSILHMNSWIHQSSRVALTTEFKSNTINKICISKLFGYYNCMTILSANSKNEYGACKTVCVKLVKFNQVSALCMQEFFSSTAFIKFA